MDVTGAPRIAACLFWPCFFCLVCVGRVVVSLWVLARAVLRWAVAACSSPMRVCTTDSNGRACSDAEFLRIFSNSGRINSSRGDGESSDSGTDVPENVWDLCLKPNYAHISRT